MAFNRRSFLGLSSLVACGTALLPHALTAAPVARALRGGLPLRAGDEQVLAFVRQYATQVRIVGASVLGRLRATGLRSLHVLAEISDPAKIQDALTIGGVGMVYSLGNFLFFTVGDVEATVENLLPDVFSARLAGLAKRAGQAFAHDGLSYDPESNQISDPFNARTGPLRLVNRAFGGATALDVALRGTFESAQLALPGGDFNAWKTRLLRQFSRAADAGKLTEAFLARLAGLADKIPSPTFQAILLSRLVSTALQQTFGIETTAAVATFIEQRGTTGAEVPDSALWLAILFGSELQSEAGVESSWTRPDPTAAQKFFAATGSSEAFAKARAFLRNR